MSEIDGLTTIEQLRPEFTAAKIALMGTTASSNKWRDPIKEHLTQLELEDGEIFDPVITDREWVYEYDYPHEKFQKKHAGLAVYYLGHDDEGNLSTLSTGEALDEMSDPFRRQNMIIVADAEGLNDHPKKQLKAIRDMIQGKYPEVTLIDTPAELPVAIAEYFGLHEEAADYVSGNPNSVQNPEAYSSPEAAFQTMVTNKATKVIDGITRQMDESMYLAPFAARVEGGKHGLTPVHHHALELAQRHFTDMDHGEDSGFRWKTELIDSGTVLTVQSDEDWIRDNVAARIMEHAFSR